MTSASPRAGREEAANGPRIVVAGAVSFYVSVGVPDFPLRYTSKCTPRWMAAQVSGSAGHISHVLRTLGADVRLCTVVGRDPLGAHIRSELDHGGLLGPGVVDGGGSSMGVALVAPDGSRLGLPHLEPVNGVTYPFETLRAAARDADLLVLTNAKFVRPLVAPAARLGVPVAVDVHLIADLADPYNLPWLLAADVVFCSHEALPCPPDAWVARILDRYPRCRLVCVGLGARGALLGTREGALLRAEAVAPRGVVNTTGAGDALFATFLHVWSRTGDVERALRMAVLHAGWKVGHRQPVTASLTGPQLAGLANACTPAVVTGHRDDGRRPDGADG
ncbi:carbohydrate kinase family protein [Sphaerisporangium sp. TRM90804]|uniref:carbohydrate kinase family protein n=1 Tax=Sphaerisporangium sp. TRM90804 TaxID=3031113 RepID=UPI0024492DD5|nr:carbohydrate kinase family protein [Sphaerisporangium sp. TRM90804]MDH2424985.1 carbohydrate kinase family protein [Sphaerisporangium sp. TRM90804]